MLYLNLDPDGRSPLYEGAMCLRDADIGVQFLTFSISSGKVWSTTLSSTCSIESEFIDTRMFVEESYIVARDSHGGNVNLSAYGIHPSIDGWDDDCFSVLVARDTVRAFHSWLLEHEYYEAATELEYDFTEFVGTRILN